MKTNEDELLRKIEFIIKENKDLEKETQKLKDKIAETSLNDYLSQAKEIKDIKYIVLDAGLSSIDDMRTLGIRQRKT